jgi:hypothetical protein
MADNIKISELVELTSGSLSDATIFPVVDGGTTKKATLANLQSYLTDDLATDSELTTQISNVNSTITGLTTDIITEGTNKYLSDVGIDTRLIAKNVVSSSAQVQNSLGGSSIVSSSQQISASAAASGFGAGGGGGASIPTGTVSSSIQTIKNLGGSTILSGSLTSANISDFSTAASASAASAGFGAGGGGGSSDYISSVSVNNSTLTFTGVGSGFNGTINLAADGSDGANLLTTGDAGNFVATGDYTTDSASFATRIGGGGGGSVPSGTVSSSAQTIKHINTVNVVSSSAQIDGAQIDLSSLSADDISNGFTNKYYSNDLVLPYLNQLAVLSGSADAGGFTVGGTGIISASQQISDFEFVLQTALNASASTLQTNIDLISSDGISANDVNVFLAKQKFTDDIEVTGSILLNAGAFSGSGAQLFGIPATAIDGLSSTTQLIDGDNNVTVDNVQGITATVGDGNFNVNLTGGTNLIVSGGYAIIASGSWFSGSGAGLTNIPASSIDGGVDGQKISSGSFSASIEDGTGNFRVHPPALFDSTISASGLITAPSIQVGTSGTPTLYSANNINLSASSAVVVTDSPFRLNPLTSQSVSEFSLTPGDMVFQEEDNDFFGYRIVNTTGSWYSLTEGSITELEWGVIIGAPAGLVSSSEQIVGVGNTLLSSSAQFLPSGAAAGTVYFEDTLNNISGASDFTYTGGTRTLTVNKVVANELVYNTSLTGAGNDTGSYGRVETDALIINSAIEFPKSDGTTNQVLKTDGNGNLDFAAFADVLGNDNITTTGTITMGTGSVGSSLSVGTGFTVGGLNEIQIAPLTTFIETVTATIQSVNNITLDTSASVVINDVLSLTPRTDNPSNPLSGSLISKTVGGVTKPYFWDGSVWTALY